MNARTSGAPPLLHQLGIEDALDLVAGYIVKQRWSGAADRVPRSVEVEDALLLHEDAPPIVFCVIRVLYDRSRAIRYALPLGLRQPEDVLAERAPEYMIGQVGSGEQTRLLYDALGDPLYVHRCVALIRDSLTLRSATGGELIGERNDDALSQVDQPPVRTLSVQQSNTSLVLDESLFFKHLRRIEEGPSQELEMAVALRTAHFEHAVPVLGTLRYRRRELVSPVVLMQPFLHNATEGWNLALTSLRDLYADAEEQDATSTWEVHSAVNDQGGAFVAEAARLGAVTAALHRALAEPGLGPDFVPRPIDAASLSDWADSMTADLDRLLRHESALLDPLRDTREAVVSRFDVLRELPPEGLRIRIHGDLHLGQMLRVSSGWVVLDFEGEPDRTPEERRQRSTPLRDVAGMLRSFDYAAAVALSERSKPDTDEWEELMAYGDAWAQSNRDAFWSAYLEVLGEHPMLPSPGAAMVLRRAFEVHKAVYETGYELGHRPTWTRIPLRFLLRGIA